MQEPLTKGQIDASYHWFNHTIFGARHELPIKAVMVINDAPAMTVMVANGVKDKIRSAADFKGKNIADGAQYGTKAVITSYLAKKAGVPPSAFTPVMQESEGRLEAVLKGLKDGKVDVMTFQEPVTSALLESNMVSTLYDLNSKASTTKVLGAAFPAQSLLMAPKYIEAHPDTVQHLVNALVRTMRFVNKHTAEEIAERLPPDYFDKEFLRLWFMDHCDPYNDATLPEAPADMVEELSRRYAAIFTQLTGETVTATQENIEERIRANLSAHLRRAS